MGCAGRAVAPDVQPAVANGFPQSAPLEPDRMRAPAAFAAAEASSNSQAMTRGAAPVPAATSPVQAREAADQHSESETDTEKVAVCPKGMVHIRFDHCPQLARRCLNKEYDEPNRIDICHRYASEKPQCRAPRVPLEFCIDEYEYPNQAGQKPPVMVDYFEAFELCKSAQKRLCYEREWVTACEGPEEKPFPYGYARSSEQCNFDQRWVAPHLDRLYSTDREVQRLELERLDRSVPSGRFTGCVSDFGVHDLTGNVDEWAIADHLRPREHAQFSALKGGAWGHVRNACRPVTTSHRPTFRYYFIGFRCCRDVRADARSN